MRNKANEAIILAKIAELSAIVAGLKNVTLGAELQRRLDALRIFVINPGAPFEITDPDPAPPVSNPSPGQMGPFVFPLWYFPDPAADDARYSPQLVSQGYGQAFANSTPYKKMELNFNWLMAQYGSNVAYTYMIEVVPVATFSNAFRLAYDSSGPASAAITNYYSVGGGGRTRSSVSEDGGDLYYGGSVTIRLPHPTGTPVAPTPPIVG